MAVYDTIAARFKWRTEAPDVQQFLQKLFEDAQLYLDSDFLRREGAYNCCDELVYAHLEDLSYVKLALLAHHLGVAYVPLHESIPVMSIEGATIMLLNHWLTAALRFHFHIDPYTDWR